MINRLHNLKRFFVFLFLLFSVSAFSAPFSTGAWLLPGDVSVKSDIDLLSDAGLIKAPVLVWPIAWENIGPDLLSPEAKAKLPKEPIAVQEAYQRIVAMYEKNNQLYKVHGGVYASGSNRLNPFPTFQYQPYKDAAAGAAATYEMKHFAGGLNLSYYHTPNESYSTDIHPDNSYAYLLLGNWAIGVDQFNRWWGPGYSDSMILSQNAEPFPAVGIQRIRAEAFQTKWLHWIGPWSVISLVSEDGPAYYRYPAGVDNENYWFTNVSFKPLQSLQFDISRNVLFAGKQRPLSADMLRNLLTLRNEDDSAYIPSQDVPGSEEWDIGANFSLMPIFNLPLTLYEQTLFSDHMGNTFITVPAYGRVLIPFPSRTDFLLGTSLVTLTKAGELRTYFEYEDNVEYRYYWWGVDPGGEIAHNTYGGQYTYTYYNNILSTALGSEGVGYTLGAILHENTGSDDLMLRFIQPNSKNWGIAGTPGYPFAKQDLIWTSMGRTITLPHHIGSLNSEIGYLISLSSQGSSARLPSSFSGTLTWFKTF